MPDILHILGEARPRFVLLAHIAIASWVTVHALLNKREVGAALGWIGLAWLSPFIGGFVYVMLGVNRVERRARRLNVPRPARTRATNLLIADDAHLAPLERANARITGRSTEPGNAFTTYQDGDAAYPAMLDAIAAATASVALSSYIFRADRVGTRFIEALAAAQRRGVAVRVLIDGVGGGWMLSPAYHRLRRAGVVAGRFIHSVLPWRMPLVNLRSHKKILVIDGRLGFTGGMNIADENVLADGPRSPVQDTHFRIEGPVVGQLMSAFAADWSFAMDEELDGPLWFPAIEPAGDAPARVITSGPDQDLEKMEFAVLQAITAARSSIQVMTPYFLPDDQIVTALGLAAMRGVAVDVVIPRNSNHRLVDWATYATVPPMLHEGARLWLGPSPFRHTKAMVVDGQWSLIGSSNWDIRSFRLNFELSMEVYDGAFALSLQRFIAANRGEQLTLDALRRTRWPTRLRNAAVRLMMPYL